MNFRVNGENPFGVIFEYENNGKTRIQYIILGILFITGILLWGQFFNWGNTPLDYHDWAEVNAPRLAFVGDAVRNGVLPFHMSDASALRGVTDRFMTLPDVILSPQVLLLGFMDVGSFVMLNIWLLYTAGFAALLWFRRKFSLSSFIFIFIFFLFNFNGHIVSHLAVGHITWGGYFLFPWLLVLLVKLFEGDRSWKWVSQTAFLLFIIFLQGSFHQFVWSCMFLGILAITFWKYFWPLFKALTGAALLSMVRILPPMLLTGSFDTDFYGGYPLARNIIEAMIFERLPAQAHPFENFYSKLGYWEFDLFIGYAGSVILGVSCLMWLIHMIRERKLSPLIIPSLVLVILAIRNNYQFLTQISSLLGAERVTSRMIILPFVFALITSAIYFQKWMKEEITSFWIRLLSLIFMGYLIYDFSVHVLRWRVTEMYAVFPHFELDLSIKVAANHPDPQYYLMFWLGLAVSFLTAVVLIFLTYKEQKQNDS